MSTRVRAGADFYQPGAGRNEKLAAVQKDTLSEI